jgi:hypothetical protein
VPRRRGPWRTARPRWEYPCSRCWGRCCGAARHESTQLPRPARHSTFHLFVCFLGGKLYTVNPPCPVCRRKAPVAGAQKRSGVETGESRMGQIKRKCVDRIRYTRNELVSTHTALVECNTPDLTPTFYHSRILRPTGVQCGYAISKTWDKFVRVHLDVSACSSLFSTSPTQTRLPSPNLRPAHALNLCPTIIQLPCLFVGSVPEPHYPRHLSPFSIPTLPLMMWVDDVERARPLNISLRSYATFEVGLLSRDMFTGCLKPRPCRRCRPQSSSHT